MWWTWTLLTAWVYGAFVERYTSFYIRSHTDMLLSLDKSNHICYGFRYREQLGEFLFPMAGIRKVYGNNFTLTPEECDLLLDFDVVEAESSVKYYYGLPDCPGPKLALVDLFILASYYRLVEWGNFTEILSNRDWSKQLSDSEIDIFRNSFYCRIVNPGQCEDDLEHFQESCPPLPYTLASPRPQAVPTVSWKLPWDQYTYRN